jgi:general stress protein YciG
MNELPKLKRGLALVDPARRREIAASGGRAVAPENRTFSRDRRAAMASGRNGGLKSGAVRRAKDGRDA